MPFFNFKYLFISLLLSCQLCVFGNDEKPESVGINYHLAISINPGQNSGYVNFAIIGENNGKLVYSKFISHSEFILVGMGIQFSAANDLGVNLFKKHNIRECLYKFDSAQCIKKPDLKLFDLWSLRYNRNPYCPPDCIPGDGMLIQGFGQHKARPSWPQLQILQKYGITYINDFFYGDKMFELLSDFQKPEWRDKYESSKE